MLLELKIKYKKNQKEFKKKPVINNRISFEDY